MSESFVATFRTESVIQINRISTPLLVSVTPQVWQVLVPLPLPHLRTQPSKTIGGAMQLMRAWGVQHTQACLHVCVCVPGDHKSVCAFVSQCKHHSFPHLNTHMHTFTTTIYFSQVL